MLHITHILIVALARQWAELDFSKIKRFFEIQVEVYF